MRGGLAIFWCRRYRVSNLIQSVSLSSIGLLHRLASKNLSLFCAHIELPQPHSRLSTRSLGPCCLRCFIKVSTRILDLKIPINHQGIYPITHRQFLLKLTTHTQHLPLQIQDPLNTESDAICSAHRQSFVFTPSNRCHGRAGHRVIRDCGRLNIHSFKIASMSRGEDYQDSLLNYRGSSSALFVNFARFHLLG